MISIGNFFFKYRNLVFIFLYLALFIPSSKVFTEQNFGANYYLWPIAIGLVITISGQLIRGLTIGLAYIVRGGKDKKVYADKLVTEGVFNHCRNPLYVGNILMLLGVGIIANSVLYLVVFIPLFLFIYQTIVLAEENFLRSKFGTQFDQYCNRTDRWFINFNGLVTTFKFMHFNAKRWLLKEYNTQYIWLAGITLLVLSYPQITNNNIELRNQIGVMIFLILTALYLFVRYLKKSGKLKD